MSNDESYDVCVIGGLGHVGLGLGLCLAKAGKKVIAYDINTKTIETVSKGRMPFIEKNAEEILGEVLNRRFFITSDRKLVAKSHFVIIIIGTPVDEHLNPRYTLMKQFFVNLMDDIHDGQHIILRSTIYPGTTEKIRQLFLSHKKKVRLSFCPERVAQGQAVEEIHSLPQIIAGFDGESIEEARELFSSITDEIIVLEPLEAELAKLFTNVWRYIQFAIANQFYQLAVDNDVDFYKIYNAITYKYPRMKGIPGAGFAAGPCLFKDTMQLANYANNTFFLGHSSMLVNEGLPNFIVQKLKSKYALRDKTVGILGMAFKANNDDNRESLSYKLKKILEIEAKAVLCSDVYIREPDFVTAGFLIENADIIVLGTPHREYASLAISDDRILVDVWNFYGKGGLF